MLESLTTSRPISLHSVDSGFVDFEEEKEPFTSPSLPSWAEMSGVPLEALYLPPFENNPEAASVEDFVITSTPFALLLEYIRDSEYKKLPDFEKFFGSVTDSLAALIPKLKLVHEALEAKTRLKKGPKSLSKEELQEADRKLSAAIQKSLEPLGNALSEVNNVIKTYQGQLPSKKHEYYIRAMSVFLTVVASVILAHIFTLSLWWMSPAVALSVLAVDTWKFYINQKLKGWKDFKATLKTSINYLEKQKDMLDNARLSSVEDKQKLGSAQLSNIENKLNNIEAREVRLSSVEDKQKLGSAQLSNIEDKFEALQKQVLLIANVVGITESSSAAEKGKAPADSDQYITKAQFEEYKAEMNKGFAAILEALKNKA